MKILNGKDMNQQVLELKHAATRRGATSRSRTNIEFETWHKTINDDQFLILYERRALGVFSNLSLASGSERWIYLTSPAGQRMFIKLLFFPGKDQTPDFLV